jgi:DNA-binding XRE family transcriptional regulator
MNQEIDAALYSEVGRRIRQARERQPAKMSQADLAKALDVSRASVVNIEAGRQHAPLSLLWRIAEKLDSELSALIPRRADLVPSTAPIKLHDDMLKQIRHKAAGNVALEQDLTSFISQAVHQLTQTSAAATPSRGRNEEHSKD